MTRAQLREWLERFSSSQLADALSRAECARGSGKDDRIERLLELRRNPYELLGLFTHVELTEMLREYGLPAWGKKDSVVRRIVDRFKVVGGPEEGSSEEAEDDDDEEESADDAAPRQRHVSGSAGRRLPLNPNVGIPVLPLGDITPSSLSEILPHVPRYGAAEFRRLVGDAVGAIHQIPAFLLHQVGTKYGLKQVDAYFGRSSGTANGDGTANVYQRLRAGYVDRGHEWGMVFATASLQHVIRYERHGIRLLDVLKELDGLCISNRSLSGVGRVGSAEPGFLYLTFRVLPRATEAARDLSREEIRVACLEHKSELGQDADGFRHGLEVANNTSMPGGKKLADYSLWSPDQ